MVPAMALSLTHGMPPDSPSPTACLLTALSRSLPPDSPSPMCVLLNGVGHVVVDHQRHVGDIDTAASHIGGHQHIVHVLAEALQAVTVR